MARKETSGESGPPNSSRERTVDPEILLLQRQRALFLRLTVNRIVYRVAALSLTALLVIWTSLSRLAIPFLSLLTVFLCAIWYVDVRQASRELHAIEEEIARRSPDQWEDAFIRTRFARGNVFGALILRDEPLFWTMLAIVAGLLRNLEMLRLIVP
jgi:hypothetical protein